MELKHKVGLEHLAEVEAYVGAPFPVGAGGWGTRLIFPVVTEGTVQGTKFNGKIHSFGADWGILRADNNFELDVRIVIETDDGAFIHVFYSGIAAMTKEQAERFLAGEVPEGLNLFVTPRFESGHENYQWLTQVQVVGRGSVEPGAEGVKVTYSWYILTA